MTDAVCQPLTARFEEKFRDGLVDIKFYVRHRSIVSPSELLAEAEAVFDAVSNGEVEDAVFNDRHMRG